MNLKHFVSTSLSYTKNRTVFYFKKLFRHPYIRTGKYGIKYLILPNSSLDYLVEQRGTIDDWDCLSKLEGIVPENGVIFDVGANVGLLSLLFSKRLAPYGQVIAYEPDEQNLHQLQENIKLNDIKNIKVVTCALQDNPAITQITFHIRRAIDGDGNENRGISSIKNLSKFQKEDKLVTASTMDLEVKRLNLQRMDFIKIDVEGAEIMVLSGGKQAITKFRPIVQYEYSNVLDKMTGDSNTKKSFDFFNDLGYDQFLETFTGGFIRLRTPDPNAQDTNVLCFPKEKTPESFRKIS